MSGAKRFGGAYSPGAAQTGSGAPRPPSPPKSPLAGLKPRKTSLRGRLLYLWPSFYWIGILSAMLQGDGGGLLWMLGAYALLMFGAWLTNEGVAAAMAYEEREVARPPAFPRKLLGGAAIALGVAGGVIFGTGGAFLGAILNGAAMGAAAFAAHVLAFGLDPMKSKGLDHVDEAERERVANALDEAEAVIAEMSRAASRFDDRALTDQVAALADAARKVLARIAADPRDMRRSRKFLRVYLTGARDATLKFAETWDKVGDPETREKYETLLTDMKGQFDDKADALLLDDRTDLDIEIDVLRKRLEREGV